VRKNRTSGSVQGASGNWRPYRDDVQIQEEGTVPQLREHMMVAKDGQILPHI